MPALLERAYDWERNHPAQIFLTQPHHHGELRQWTWSVALNESRRIAAHLNCYPPGAHIAILSKNSAWWILADLAIWISGRVSVPIYPSLRAAHIRDLLQHSEARACFLGPTEEHDIAAQCALPDLDFIALPNAAGSAAIEWDHLLESNLPIPGNPIPDPESLATIIYTSGTTGAPKGVMHCHAALAADAEAITRLLAIESEQRLLSYLPLAHIVERVGVEACAILCGWHIFFGEGLDTFLADLHRARPTLFLSVPRLLLKFQQGVFARIPPQKLDRLLRIPGISRVLKHRILHRLGLDTVHHAASGAAPLPPEMLLWFRKLGLDLMEGYGMTETMVTHLPPPDGERPGYVGAPLQGVETRVSAQNELLIRGPSNMLGYFRDPALTAQAFTPDGFFKTGDIVETAPDGQIKIIGRIKEQFKTSKGKYVAPAPIESLLMQHPDVESCCLMGSGQPSPFAVVVISAAARARCADPVARRALEAGLLARVAAINAGLEAFERIEQIVIADGPWTIANGFLTPTLKIRRAAVEAEYQKKLESWTSQALPILWETPPTEALAA